MNNFKKLTIVGTICLSSLVATSVFAANTAKVTAETARMRSKASTDSSIVQLISMNEEVTIIEKSGDWYKIKYKGQTGYISKSLLDVDGNSSISSKNTTSEKSEVANDTSTESKAEENSNAEEVAQEAATVEESDDKKETSVIKEGYQGKLKSKVELRILPLINSSKTLVLSENLDIEIVEVVNNWCSVKTSSSYGWVLKSSLESAIGEMTKQENATPEETVDAIETEETKQDDIEKKEETKAEETTKKEETTSTSKTGYINVDTVNVRKEKSTTSAILTNANKNVAVQILGEEDNWTKVKINGITGYIASKYISDSRLEVTSRGAEDTRQPATGATTTQETTNNQTTPQATTPKTSTTASSISKVQTSTTNTNKSTSTSTSSGNGDAVVAYAKQYLGSKYVSGGSSPSTGFDCSGFTSYVYKHFGKSLSRTSSGQRSNGTQVSKSNLQKGDIVCFTGHVGIYIGNNKFIHAANPRKGVVITSLSDSYYVKNYITARRIK